MKRRKKPEAITLVFTRPFNLFTAEYWRDPLLLRNLKKHIGSNMRDQITHYNGRTQFFYRIASDADLLKETILSLPPGHRIHSPRACQGYRRAVGLLRAIMRRRHTDAGLWNAYKESLRAMEKLYSWYLLGVFLPGRWADEYRARYGRAGDIIVRRHYRNRKLSEGLLGDFSAFIDRIVTQRLCELGSPVHASLLRRSEVEALLRSNKVPPHVVNKRRSGYVHIGGRLLLDVSFNAAIKRMGYTYRPESVHVAQEISGMVAYKAKPVTGRVRIIFSPKEILTFKKGEILVTPMTQPDFIPAIRQAKAIVTDEGSITCHAAIVARELRKPCVIGMKVATKVLKNGDRVTVNAINGTVKKI